MNWKIDDFDHVQLPIPPGSTQQAIEFYTESLGLPEKPRPEALLHRPGAWFQFGPYEIHLLEEDPFKVSPRHPAFRIGQLADTRRQLEENGVRTKDTSKFPDRERFFFYDPFGNRFELIEFHKGS
ncbi:VOC family protein [Pontibacter sp. G13]|uniref:VOC family protein n=1 Tax=Pontibacter sp. G13 TaxID=3074898 RepID=UPI00288C3FDB|nr:VOC family protein [Pontibacter sp. G13]WNJ19194.1 VOC family protein [Pontibacter sp. G13]